MVSSSAFILEQTSSRLEMREDMVTDYNTTTRYSVRPTQRKWGSARLWDTVCPQAYSYWRMLGPRVNLSPGNATVNLSTRHKVIFPLVSPIVTQWLSHGDSSPMQHSIVSNRLNRHSFFSHVTTTTDAIIQLRHCS